MARVAAGATGYGKAVGLLTALLLTALLLAAVAACSGEPAEEGPRESGTSTGGSAERGAGGPRKGPYKVRTEAVSPSEVGGDFGTGTVHYPDDKSRDHPVIAASPGLGADESMVAPYGELLASHGFVVITFNTRTTEDSPSQRGSQLLHALDHAAKHSAAADRADPQRLGVLGHSMGGGGALYAAARNPAIKAAVPLTPYAERREWRRIQAPTLIVGGSTDEVAPTSKHAEVFYEGLSGAKEKAYLELNGDHFVATPPDALVARQVVAWFKRFLAGDTRAADRLCPPPRSARVTESRDTCPLG